MVLRRFRLLNIRRFWYLNDINHQVYISIRTTFISVILVYGFKIYFLYAIIASNENCVASAVNSEKIGYYGENCSFAFDVKFDTEVNIAPCVNRRMFVHHIFHNGKQVNETDLQAFRSINGSIAKYTYVIYLTVNSAGNYTFRFNSYTCGCSEIWKSATTVLKGKVKIYIV